MRLIDADRLKQDIANFMPARVEVFLVIDSQPDAIALLKEQDTVEHACDILRANGWKETEPLCSECDAVHVVRCMDCIWWHQSETNEAYGDCGQANGIALKPFDWFCADGERRTDDA